jgi:hypothetical protein
VDVRRRSVRWAGTPDEIAGVLRVTWPRATVAEERQSALRAALALPGALSQCAGDPPAAEAGEASARARLGVCFRTKDGDAAQWTGFDEFVVTFGESGAVTGARVTGWARLTEAEAKGKELREVTASWNSFGAGWIEALRLIHE